MRFPTSAQFARLATLGVTEPERALLSQRGHDHPYIADLIDAAVRWPLGTGGLRYYRLFHEYPRGARSLADVGAADHDAITAWRHLDTLRSNLETAFGSGSWSLLGAVQEASGSLAEIARTAQVDAFGNPAIEQRIEEATVLLAGYTTAARRDGRMGPHDYTAYAAPLPEEVRRAGREWRALAGRQHRRALATARARWMMRWA